MAAQKHGVVAGDHAGEFEERVRLALRRRGLA
jgi:hypothetical protein